MVLLVAVQLGRLVLAQSLVIQPMDTLVALIVRTEGAVYLATGVLMLGVSKATAADLISDSHGHSQV